MAGYQARNLKEGLSRARTDFFQKGCFHADGSCSETIVFAHSIQNNRVLNKISEDGEVLCFGSEGDEFRRQFSPQRVGRKRATVFTGFCGYHDQAIFRPIETRDYEPGNRHQEFLFAYRAFAKEYFTKLSVGSMFSGLLSFIENRDEESLKRYLPRKRRFDWDRLEVVCSSLVEGTLWSLARMETCRTILNQNLKDGRFDRVRTDIVAFPREYPVAASSNFLIERDVEGNIINDMDDDKVYLRHTFLSIFPQGGKTYVLLSHLAKDKKNFEWLGEQLLFRPLKEQRIIVSNLLAIYVDNLVVGPAFWREAPSRTKDRFCTLFGDTFCAKPGTLVPEPALDLFEPNQGNGWSKKNR